MSPGQSRRLVDPMRLATAQSYCRTVNRRGSRKFEAGLDAHGVARIWRLE
jgi:hypothetical protein